MKRTVSRIVWTDPRGALLRPLTAAVAPDLHNKPFDDPLPHLRGVDVILIPGDLTNRHRPGHTAHAAAFLAAAGKIAPTFFSLGNHERKMYGDRHPSWMHQEGVTLLDGSCVLFREDLLLGGIGSGAGRPAGTGVIPRMARFRGFRLLLCHHPEHYPMAVAGHGIDLTLAGHAHGGQVRLFGRGLYAPGQGFFPEYTSGLYDGGKLLVSRGLSNHGPVPRLFNPCELILLTLLPASGVRKEAGPEEQGSK